MSSVIRSLVVRVGADLTKFNKNIELAAKAMKEGFGALDLNQTKSALSGLSQSVKLTESEFRKATAGMDDWKTNADGLRARVSYLNDSMDDHKTILEGLKRQYQLVSDEQGESTQEATKLKIAINNQTAKIKESEAELGQMTNKLENFGRETDQATDKSNLLGKIFAGGFLANIAANALTSIGNKLKEFATQALETADELKKMESVTGFTTTELQKMQYVGDDLGVTLETQSGALKKLINNMSAAKAKTGTAYEAFQKLKISVTDTNGELKDSNEIYYDVIDALKKVTNETERDAIAQDILGKSATDLNPLIEAGSEVLKDLSEQAEETGAIMSEDAVDALDSFGDSVDHLKQKVETFVGEALAGMIDAFGSVNVDEITTAADAVREAGEKYQQTTENMETAAEVASDYADNLDRLEEQGLNTAAAHEEYRLTVDKLNSIMPGLNLVIDAQTGLIEGGTTALRAHIAALKEDALTQALQQKYIDTIKTQADAVWELKSNQDALKASKAEETNILIEKDKIYNKLAKSLGISSDEVRGLAKDTNALNTFALAEGKDIAKYAQELAKLDNQLGKAQDNTKDFKDAVKIGEDAVKSADLAIAAATVVFETLTGKQIDGTDAMNQFANATDAAAQAAVDATDKYGEMYSNGQNFMQGFMNGMSSKKTAVEKEAYALAHSAELAVASALGIHSPSKVMEEKGEYTGEGFGIGIKNRLGFVTEQMTSIADAVRKAALVDLNVPSISLAMGQYASDMSQRSDAMNTLGHVTTTPDVETGTVTQKLTVDGEINVNGINSQGELIATTKLLAEQMSREGRRRSSGISFNSI